ncbi:protein-L-isoaspartate O-methyltransferase family protein [Georgenia deserti]|uniref:Protein-L-isoaspartate O-methyltransferase n=1 Tax=Georgenia deserti TaxID=2093781 RepID=A0ABW4L9V9_9MICO
MSSERSAHRLRPAPARFDRPRRTVRRVRETMAVVDRRIFLPADQARFAHADMPLQIGYGATCSQPSTVEAMLQLLQPSPGDRVLDVGSGSGWTTALLARLVAPGGSVIGVEIEPELVEIGRENLAAWGGVEGVPARIEQAVPGRVGMPEKGPFDRILVSADARELPTGLLEQLADGGRMVVPVRGRMAVVDRIGEDVQTRYFGSFSFVPLRAAD